jgi:hypothetical protein
MTGKAIFLWPCLEGSIEEAGFEFANARTESYREVWWKILIERIEFAEAVKHDPRTKRRNKLLKKARLR